MPSFSEDSSVALVAPDIFSSARAVIRPGFCGNRALTTRSDRANEDHVFPSRCGGLRPRLPLQIREI